MCEIELPCSPLRCAACKKKLFKYEKLGKGEVLRCHKRRIERFHEVIIDGDRLVCPCGAAVGIDKGSYFKMIRNAFVYSGTKVTKL